MPMAVVAAAVAAQAAASKAGHAARVRAVETA
jgi:hypothetical protein